MEYVHIHQCVSYSHNMQSIFGLPFSPWCRTPHSWLAARTLPEDSWLWTFAFTITSTFSLPGPSYRIVMTIDYIFDDIYYIYLDITCICWGKTIKATGNAFPVVLIVAVLQPMLVSLANSPIDLSTWPPPALTENANFIKKDLTAFSRALTAKGKIVDRAKHAQAKRKKAETERKLRRQKNQRMKQVLWWIEARPWASLRHLGKAMKRSMGELL